MIRRKSPTRLGGLLTAFAVAAGALTASVLPGSAAVAATGGTGTGWLHTNGSKIVDSTGATVKLTGLNWFGMETDNLTFHGLWAGRPATWTQQIDHMASLGYNTIRVPYTGASIQAGAKATSINTDTNPDLVGLSSLEVLDKVVDYAGSKGMRIILDRHRPTTAGQTPLWNGAGVSEASMIADWKSIVTRYKNNPTVVGADLFNEPHADGTDPQGTGADWGGGDARDWRLAAERIGNAILGVNPNLLIIVEGVSCSMPSGGTLNQWDNIPDDPQACTWWGGNLSLAAKYPVRLDVANRLVYSPHEYGVSVFTQTWFSDPSFPDNLPAVWDHYWGYLSKQNIAPILVGEFGSTLADPRDTQWLKKLMEYMGQNGMSFTYWSWNPDSGDTGGIVSDDWNTVNQAKQSIIGPYLVAPVAGSIGSTPVTTTVPTTQVPTTPVVTPTRTSTGPGTTTGPATPTTVPTTPSTSSGACSATYKTVSSYQGGFQGEITVTAGSAAITGWKVSWTLGSGQTISQIWSGTLSTSGGSATVSNLVWNGSLASRASTVFGFISSGTATVPAVACTTA